VALVPHARLNPVDSPRDTPVRDVLSPSLRAHIEDSGSAAATKCANPATMDPLFQAERFPFGLKRGSIVAGFTHFVAAALPESPICALELGDRTSLTDVSRLLSTGLRRACSISATAPPVRFREVVYSQGVTPTPKPQTPKPPKKKTSVPPLRGKNLPTQPGNARARCANF